MTTKRTTISSFTRKLKDISKAVESIKDDADFLERARSRLPDEINEIRQTILDAYQSLGVLEQKTEVSSAHESELSIRMAEAVDALRNLRTIAGDDGRNLAFMEAVDKNNLRQFLDFLLEFPEAFRSVISEMTDEEYQKLQDICHR